MLPLRRLGALMAALIIFVSAARAQDNFYLKDGDRVVFYGDSITDSRLYTNFVQTYAEEADVVAKQRAAAQPVPHYYELNPQP